MVCVNDLRKRSMCFGDIGVIKTAVEELLFFCANCLELYNKKFRKNGQTGCNLPGYMYNKVCSVIFN